MRSAAAGTATSHSGRSRKAGDSAAGADVSSHPSPAPRHAPSLPPSHPCAAGGPPRPLPPPPRRLTPRGPAPGAPTSGTRVPPPTPRPRLRLPLPATRRAEGAGAQESQPRRHPRGEPPRQDFGPRDAGELGRSERENPPPSGVGGGRDKTAGRRGVRRKSTRARAWSLGPGRLRPGVGEGTGTADAGLRTGVSTGGRLGASAPVPLDNVSPGVGLAGGGRGRGLPDAGHDRSPARAPGPHPVPGVGVQPNEMPDLGPRSFFSSKACIE